MPIEILKQIQDKISKKYSTTFKIESNESEIKTSFPVPLVLEDQYNYEIGLMWFATYNTIYNVHPGNYLFNYNGDFRKLEPGSYEFKDINEAIQNLTNYKVEIKVEEVTSKTLLYVHEGVVSFPYGNCISKILGFPVNDEKNKYGKGVHKSPGTIKISSLTSINIECDLVSSSFDNGIQSNLLYSMPAYTVPSGYRIIERATVPVYLPIVKKTISDINIRIVDQKNELIHFNGENISILLHLKQI